MASQPQAARQHFSSSMVNNVINLCRSRCGTLAHRPAPPHTQCRAGSPVGGGCRQRFQKPGGLGAKQLAARSQGCTEGPGACTSWPGAPRGPPEAESSWPSCVGATFLSTGSLLQDEGQGTRMGAHSTAGAPRSLPGWRGWGSCPLCREPGQGSPWGFHTSPRPGGEDGRKEGPVTESHPTNELPTRPVPPPRLQMLPGSSCLTCGPARSCRVSSDR